MKLLEHPMEPIANRTCSCHTTPNKSKGTNYQMSAAVYVEDFLGAAVENSNGTLVTQTARATLQAFSRLQLPQILRGQKTPFPKRSLPKGTHAGSQPKRSLDMSWKGYTVRSSYWTKKQTCC
jgi:hypothetical protein